MGRFLEPDPIGFMGGVNFYAYVGNNSINFVDQIGLSGYLTIYSSKGDNGSLGYGNHSWVGYKSDSGEQHMYGTWRYPGTLVMDHPSEWSRMGDSNTSLRTLYLNDDQEAQMYDEIDRYKNMGNDAWSYWSPCSAAASDIWRAGTGENLQDRHLGGLGYSDPNVLAKSIDSKNKTNSKCPKK